jgi:hypothetical protein
MPDRDALFISHATPADNAFVRWLGAKLTALGYEVWADVLRLHGGADWSRDLEEALRNRAVKMLLVCTPSGLDRQGVRNEIEIGAELARELNDREFIIPLRLEPYKPPFRIAQAQYVDFSRSWATGLTELVDLLKNAHKVPLTLRQPIGRWLEVQSEGSARLVSRPERLVSNWLPFRRLPATIHYYERGTELPLEHFQNRALHSWPIVPFHNGVLTFAHTDKFGLLTPGMIARKILSLPTSEFLENGWRRLGMPAHEARRQFSDLGNQAAELFLKNRGLTCYESSQERRAWWGNIRTVPLTQISFHWPYLKGRRQIIGISEKRGTHWHYGVSTQVRTSPIRHLRISPRLIFSENGLDALDDSKRAHRLRRSFAKSWRNARWRDMQMAFLWWLASGHSDINIPVSHDESMTLALPPASFRSPVSVINVGEGPPDEDDPDVEVEEWVDFTDETPEELYISG